MHYLPQILRVQRMGVVLDDYIQSIWNQISKKKFRLKITYSNKIAPSIIVYRVPPPSQDNYIHLFVALFCIWTL